MFSDSGLPPPVRPSLAIATRNLTTSSDPASRGTTSVLSHQEAKHCQPFSYAARVFFDRAAWRNTSPQYALPKIAELSTEFILCPFCELCAVVHPAFPGTSIYRGILTGYNTAFIVDQATRDAIVAADPRSAELLKPVLRGRDIERYRANWAGLWLIATFPSLGIDINDYPAIKRHLLQFGKQRLSQTGQRLPSGGSSRKRTSHEWFELQDTCAYHAAFAGQKLVWIELADQGRFAYDDTGMFVEATTFMLTGEPAKLLCGLLNSTLAHWYVRKTAPTSGMGTPRWKKVYVESVPVVTPNTALASALSKLVDEARAVTDSIRLAQIEDRIDSLVYRAYGISSHEVDALS